MTTNGGGFYLDIDGILALFRGFRNFEEFRSEQERLGVFRGSKDLPVLLKRVRDASRYQQALQKVYEELTKTGEGAAVVVLEDEEGNYGLGYVELLYQGRGRPLIPLYPESFTLQI